MSEETKTLDEIIEALIAKVEQLEQRVAELEAKHVVDQGRIGA